MPNQSLVDTLNAVNGILQIATLAEGIAVPLVTGIVKDVKAFLNETTGELEYTVVITQGQMQAQQAIASFMETLTLVNAERAKAGKPALPVPGQ